MAVSDLDYEFNVSDTIAYILKMNYDRIALQFPDELLKYSCLISTTLRNETGRNIYVLADTTFSSCCIDEIAAQHVDAQLIVHYGHACMSFIKSIDVFYVFPREKINFSVFLNQIKSINSKILLFWDVKYHHLMNDLKGFLDKEDVDWIVWSELEGVYSQETKKCLLNVNDVNSQKGKIGQRSFNTPISDLHILYIGQESLSSLNIQLSTLEAKGFSIYDPEKEQISLNSASKLISKRYYLVQKAKDAERIGIVVGTLGIESYLEVIQNLSDLITKVGKRVYIFSIGKPNPAKLGNFLDIDVFILVACPENSLLDSKEFLRPIITPFEALLAFGDLEWTGLYDLNLTSVSNQISKTEIKTIDEPYFSLSSGTFKSRRSVNDYTGGSDLITQNTQMSRLTGELSSFEAFKERSFQGLESETDPCTPSEIVKGRSGIASGYSHEMNH